MPNIGRDTVDLLAVLRLPGFGPVRALAAVERLGTPAAVLDASESQLLGVPGIGPRTARAFRHQRDKARDEAAREAERADAAGVRIITALDPGYPPLLRPLPDRPAVLYIRGTFQPDTHDRYAAGVVGSRRCSAYGLEQAERFGAALASAGICVVSGGARGIDSAAHRGAIAARGRTIVVQGCGLNHIYPPENRAMFDQIIDSHGCVLSELPMDSPPSPEHFPSRNRIISGLSLGVLVVEAGRKSGALITARQAAEDHGREVFAIPGRVDQPACAGSLDLIKSGGALLVTEPADVISGLESPARHAHGGTFADRFAPAPHDERNTEAGGNDNTAAPLTFPSEAAEQIYLACAEPRSVDELVRVTGLPSATLAREITMLELRSAIIREGSHLRQKRK